MKKIISIVFILYSFCPVQVLGQTQDLIESIQKLALEKDSLQKQVIKPLQDSLVTLTTIHLAEVAELRVQIDTLAADTTVLNKKIKVYEKEIAGLNKNKIKTERDSLQKQIVSLHTEISTLQQTIDEKEQQITEQQKMGEEKVQIEKEKIKNELWTAIAGTYKNKTLDELIKSSTLHAVQRDKQLMGNNEEITPLLVGLENYFMAEKLLAQKYDRTQVIEIQTWLEQIEQPSELLDKLKDDLEYYQDFSNELKKTIEKLVDLDEKKRGGDEEEFQKMKRSDVLAELADYMYNYYDYVRYPYLSDIVSEIITRKFPDADADLTDLLIQLP